MARYVQTSCKRLLEDRGPIFVTIKATASQLCLITCTSGHLPTFHHVTLFLPSRISAETLSPSDIKHIMMGFMKPLCRALQADSQHILPYTGMCLVQGCPWWLCVIVKKQWWLVLTQGDPSAVPYAVETVQELLGQKPMFGICMGHQLLGQAFGGKTFKLKFGHHGGNHPVRHNDSGKSHAVSIA